MSKHYLKSDGNGGLQIGKHTAVLVTVILFLVGVVGSFVFNWGVVNEKVDTMQINLIYQQDNLVDVQSYIFTNNKKIAIIEYNIINIQDDISEIKQMLLQIQEYQI